MSHLTSRTRLVYGIHMKQLTIRGFEAEIEREIRHMARKEGTSLNQAALRLLRRGAGIGTPPEHRNVIGFSLDHLIGTWTEEEAKELAEAIQDLEKIDESMWP